MKVNYLFLIVALFQFKIYCYAQTVDVPFGTLDGITNIEEYNDNLVIFNSGKSTGKPIQGVEMISESTGEQLGHKFNITGTITCLIDDGEGGYFIAGYRLKINGNKTNSHLIRVDSTGTIDKEYIFNIIATKEHEPHAYLDSFGQISALVRNGDSLFLSGAFSHVNGEEHLVVACININSKEVVPWINNIKRPSFIADMGHTYIKKVDNKLLVWGDFSHVAKIPQNNFAAFDIHSLEPIESPSTQTLISKLIMDSSSIYLSGEFNVFGLPRHKVAVLPTNIQKSIVSPMDQADFGSSQINCFHSVDSGCYLGGKNLYYKDTTLGSSLVYISNTGVTKPIDLGYTITPFDIIEIGDTMIILGYSRDTSIIVHYFNTKTWQTERAPFNCSSRNDYNSIYLQGGLLKPQEILIVNKSNYLTLTDGTLVGSIRFNITTGHYTTFPAIFDFKVKDQILYFISNDINNVPFKADYYKYDLGNDVYLTSPHNTYTRSYGLELMDSFLFVHYEGKPRINDSLFSPIVKYNHFKNSVVHWNPAVLSNILDNHISPAVDGIHIHNDTLYIFGQWDYPIANAIQEAALDPQKYTNSTILRIDPLTGENYGTKNWFNGKISDLEPNSHNQLVVFGDFSLMNYTYSSIARLNRKTLKIDTSLRNVNQVLAIEQNNENLFVLEHQTLNSINKQQSKLKSKLLDLKLEISNYSGPSSLKRIGTTLYINGDFTGITSYSSSGNAKFINQKRTAALDLSSNKILAWNPKYSTALNFMTGTDGLKTYSLNQDLRTSTTTNVLTDTLYRTFPVSLYNRKTQSLSALNIKRTSSPSNNTSLYLTKSLVNGDHIYISNINISGDPVIANNVYIYNLDKESLESPIFHFRNDVNYGPGTVHDMKMFEENILLVAGDFNFTMMDKNYNNLYAYNVITGQIFNNFPSFNGAINSICIVDSIAYLGGSFSYVNGIPQPGLAKVDLKTNKLIKMGTPFNGGCFVKHISEKNGLICLTGGWLNRNNTQYKTFLVIDKEFNIDYKHSPEINETFQAKSSIIQDDILFIFGLRTKTFDINTGEEINEFDKLDIRADNIYFSKGVSYFYGRTPNVTSFSDNFVSAIDITKFRKGFKITNYTPKSMATNKSYQLEICGSGFTKNTVLYLRSQSLILKPIDSTIRVDNGGIRMSGFIESGSKSGLFDLVAIEKGDTINIKEAIEIGPITFSPSSISIEGPDSIRPNIWSTYSIKLKNNSNIDYKNIPIFIAADALVNFKIRELVENGNNLEFDVDNDFVLLDSLNTSGNLHNVFGLIVKNWRADKAKVVNIAIKPRTTGKVQLYAWQHSALSGTENQDSVYKAYSALINASSSICAKPVIEQLDINANKIKDYRANRKEPIVSFSSFLDDLHQNCGISIDKQKITQNLTPRLKNIALKYSSDGSKLSSYDGRKPFKNKLPTVKDISVVNSYDPNIKTGLRGYSKENFVQQIPKQVQYKISFENHSMASASVQRLVIKDKIDVSQFESTTVLFSEISLGDYIIQLDGLVSEIDGYYDIDSTLNFILKIQAKVDPILNEISWIIQAVNRKTYSETDLSVSDGFLPPNHGNFNGVGHVSFFIEKLSSSIKLSNKASIYFDKNPAIHTPVWNITQDSSTPISRIQKLELSKNGDSVLLQWAGNDSGSGIKNYSVYFSNDNINYHPLFEHVTITSFNWNIDTTKTYYFYSLAEDNVGNIESKNNYDKSTDTNLNSVNATFNGKIRIFPNPSSGKFSIFSSDNQNYGVKIFNQNGGLVESAVFNNHYSVSILKKGLYIVIIFDQSGNQFTSKIIVN